VLRAIGCGHIAKTRLGAYLGLSAQNKQNNLVYNEIYCTGCYCYRHIKQRFKCPDFRVVLIVRPYVNVVMVILGLYTNGVRCLGYQKQVRKAVYS
jgi:hypothetical protein